MENKVVVVDGKSVLYRRNRSSRWQCRIKLKDGTWHRISTGTCDLEEATDKAVEYYHNARVKTQLKLPQASRRFKSVAQLAINQMNTALEHNRGKKVFKDYIAALNQYFIPYFGNYSIDRITIQRVEDFEEWRLNKMNSSQMAKSTLNTHNSAVMRVFKLAVSRNWLSEEQIPPFKYEGTKSQVRPGFTRQEYYELARNLRYWADSGVADKDSSKNKFLGDKKPRETTSMNRELLRDYVLILANTGARHGTEMAELKWKDIDWYIDRENKEYLQMTVDGKTGNRQLIARHKVVTYLKRIQSRFDDLSKYSFDELLRARVDEYVFRLRNGSLPKTLDRNFQQYLDKLNLLHGTTSDQKRTLYSLRHFYATYMIENNVSPAILAKQMGTSIGMIEKHYSKFIPNMAAAMLSGERYQDKLGLKNASV